MENKKDELSTLSQDLLTVSFLGQNGIEAPKLFARDILLMVTMINGAMHVDGFGKRTLSRRTQELPRIRRVSSFCRPHYHSFSSVAQL